MLILVLGNNLLVTFVGWEGVGLCSYLLIGFWFTDPQKAAAGMKAFVTNRIGDAGFLIGIFLLFYTFNTVNYAELAARMPASAEVGLFRSDRDGVSLPCSSAPLASRRRFRFMFGFPDAMAGPTPVSALIHAATMVTAGVYMIVRMSGVFIMAPCGPAHCGLDWGADSTRRGDDRNHAMGHQEDLGLFDSVAIGIYVSSPAGVGAFHAAMFHSA